MTVVPMSTQSTQIYRTPNHVFTPLNLDLGPFGLDAAADENNTKCLEFLDEARNALSPDTKWYSGTGKVWCNPPYKKILPWVLRAEKAVEDGECERVVLLLPLIAAKWFTRCLINHEVQIYDGRIAFDLPEGMTNKRSPANASIAVVIEKDGLKGLTAVRSAKTGQVIHDFTETARVAE